MINQPIDLENEAVNGLPQINVMESIMCNVVPQLKSVSSGISDHLRKELFLRSYCYDAKKDLCLRIRAMNLLVFVRFIHVSTPIPLF